MDNIIELIFNSLQTGAVYALAALGIALIFRAGKVTNFAQGMIGTFNAYVAAILFRALGFSIWVVVPIALISAFLTGVIIDKVFIRPAQGSSPMHKQIITLGIIMILTGIIPFIFGVDPIRLGRFFPEGGMDFVGATLRWNTLFTVALSVFLMAAIFWFIQYTRWGLAIRVTAADKVTAQMMGVPTNTVTMMTWATAAMLGTLAGIIIAPQSSVNTTFMLNVQVSAFFGAIFGGLQTFHGPVIAAFIIALARNSAMYYLSDIWGNAIVYIAILIFLFFKPYGLFGEEPVEKV
ncbi:MAG: branched-chain amino acid ABC transporter permease [Bacillota bacterium]